MAVPKLYSIWEKYIGSIGQMMIAGRNLSNGTREPRCWAVRKRSTGLQNIMRMDLALKKTLSKLLYGIRNLPNRTMLMLKLDWLYAIVMELG